MFTASQIEKKLIRIYPHPDFKKKGIYKEIFDKLPDYDNYLKKKEATQLQFKTISNDCMRPCYEEPLLTREQEQHLFKQYNYCKFRAEKYYKKNNITETVAWLKKGQPAANVLAGSHVRLAIPILKKYHVKANFEDLVAESYFLTCRAIDYFDWLRGFKFSTYVTWCSRRSLGRTAMYYTQQSERHFTVDDLFAESIPSNEDTEKEMIETLALKRKLLSKLLKICNEREAIILVEMIMKDKTLKYVGQKLGITKERVRQIKENALEKIRDALSSPHHYHMTKEIAQAIRDLGLQEVA